MRFPQSNQTGLQTPVNFQVDLGSAPGWNVVQVPQVVLYVSPSPAFTVQQVVTFDANTLAQAVALSSNTNFYWKYRIHWVGVNRVGFSYQQMDLWTPYSETWVFRTATDAGQLPPAPVNQNTVPPSGLPSTQAPPTGNPNVNEAGLFSSLIPGGTMSTQNWIILAVIAVAVWYFFIRK